MRLFWFLNVRNGDIRCFYRFYRCGVGVHSTPEGYAAVPYVVCTVLCFKYEQVVAGKANVCCLSQGLEKVKGHIGHAVHCFEWIGGATLLNLNTGAVSSEVEFIVSFA